MLAEVLVALTVYTALPLLWLRVAGRVEVDKRGLGVVAGVVGYGLSATLALMLLRAIDERRRRLLARRGFGDDDYRLPERLVVWGTVAVVLVLGIWFVLGPGAKPPLPR